MLRNTKAFSGFSAGDIPKAKEFYEKTLGLDVTESHGVLTAEKGNLQYLIDAITGMAASYELSFTNEKTKKAKLEYYLSFAKDFGLADQGATLDKLLPLLPTVADGADNFGTVTVDYQVRYSEEALRKLSLDHFNEAQARQLMRKLVLANYLSNPGLTDLGWV